VKIKMLVKTKGSEDGIHVIPLDEGHEYNVRDGLARSLIEGGLAVAVQEEKPVTEVPRPDLEAIVRGVVQDIRHPDEPEEVATDEDATPEEPSGHSVSKLRKSKRTR